MRNVQRFSLKKESGRGGGQDKRQTKCAPSEGLTLPDEEGKRTTFIVYFR